jgi:hypothetical protein
MLRRCQGLNQCRTQLIGQESERAGLAFIGNAALTVNQVNAIGPAGIRSLGRVAKLVEHAGKLYPQLAHTSPGDERTFFLIFRTGKYDLISDVALHLPDVAGMRFRDVYHQESHTITILLVKFVEGGNLPPEWRSGIASKNQHDRLLLIQGGKLHAFGLVQFEQGEIRSRVSNLQISRAGAHPKRLKRK